MWWWEIAFVVDVLFKYLLLFIMASLSVLTVLQVVSNVFVFFVYYNWPTWYCPWVWKRFLQYLCPLALPSKTASRQPRKSENILTSDLWNWSSRARHVIVPRSDHNSVLGVRLQAEHLNLSRYSQHVYKTRKKLGMKTVFNNLKY